MLNVIKKNKGSYFVMMLPGVSDEKYWNGTQLLWTRLMVRKKERVEWIVSYHWFQSKHSFGLTLMPQHHPSFSLSRRLERPTNRSLHPSWRRGLPTYIGAEGIIMFKTDWVSFVRICFNQRWGKVANMAISWSIRALSHEPTFTGNQPQCMLQGPFSSKWVILQSAYYDPRKKIFEY